MFGVCAPCIGLIWKSVYLAYIGLLPLSNIKLEGSSLHVSWYQRSHISETKQCTHPLENYINQRMYIKWLLGLMDIKTIHIAYM